MSSTPLRFPINVQFRTSAREFQKTVKTPLFTNGRSPEFFATTSSPVLETLPTNKQLMRRAELPARRSIAAPVACARFLRNTQFSIKTGVCLNPCCWTEMPAPHGLVKLSTTSTFWMVGEEWPKILIAPPSEKKKEFFGRVRSGSICLVRSFVTKLFAPVMRKPFSTVLEEIPSPK